MVKINIINSPKLKTLLVLKQKGNLEQHNCNDLATQENKFQLCLLLFERLCSTCVSLARQNKAMVFTNKNCACKSL